MRRQLHQAISQLHKTFSQDKGKRTCEPFVWNKESETRVPMMKYGAAHKHTHTAHSALTTHMQ